MRSTILRLVKLVESDDWYDDSPRTQRKSTRYFLYVVDSDKEIRSSEASGHEDHREHFGQNPPEARGRAYLTPAGLLHITPYYSTRGLMRSQHRQDLEDHFRYWHGLNPSRVSFRDI